MQICVDVQGTRINKYTEQVQTPAVTCLINESLDLLATCLINKRADLTCNLLRTCNSIGGVFSDVLPLNPALLDLREAGGTSATLQPSPLTAQLSLI
jgi:hypothetical protein